LADLFRLESHGMTGGNGIQLQLAVTGDNGQKSVEIMGNATGEAANGFHFLRLAELSLDGLAVADVTVNTVDGVQAGADNDGRNEKRDLNSSSVLALPDCLQNRQIGLVG